MAGCQCEWRGCQCEWRRCQCEWQGVPWGDAAAAQGGGVRRPRRSCLGGRRGGRGDCVVLTFAIIGHDTKRLSAECRQSVCVFVGRAVFFRCQGTVPHPVKKKIRKKGSSRNSVGTHSEHGDFLYRGNYC